MGEFFRRAANERAVVDYFADESVQVQPAEFAAFGIPVHSRFGKAGEIVEMIDFAKRAAAVGVAHYVSRLFYNSKTGVCHFHLIESVKEGDMVSNALLEIGEQTISYFVMFGVCHCSHAFAQSLKSPPKARD
jgi:hypothetical protein